jgi:hypothetical protein
MNSHYHNRLKQYIDGISHRNYRETSCASFTLGQVAEAIFHGEHGNGVVPQSRQLDDEMCSGSLLQIALRAGEYIRDCTAPDFPEFMPLNLPEGVDEMEFIDIAKAGDREREASATVGQMLADDAERKFGFHKWLISKAYWG